MNKEELRDKFDKNVNYLMKNIAPDDIYMFAEQTFMACLFFIHKWSECADVSAECEKDEVVKKWVNNILGLQACRDKGVEIQLDLNLESLE